MQTDRHNRYPAECDTCAQAIAPEAGILIQGPPRKRGGHFWKVRCKACAAKAPETDDTAPEGLPFFGPGESPADDRRAARNGITVSRFSSGAVVTRNARGRCEDAPCCGCCT